MLSNLEKIHRRETQDSRGEVSGMAVRVEAIENKATETDARLKAQEEQQAKHTTQLLALHLHVEDLEDISRRNHLRLQDIPEVEGPEDLQQIMTMLFQMVLDSTDPIRLDRVHRAIGPKPLDAGRPREVICCLHQYG